MRILNTREQEIQRAIEMQDYHHAGDCLQYYGEEKPDKVLYAIFDASIALGLGDVARCRDAIAAGLAIDARNYELYVILGDSYIGRNNRQAYLCYENAYFYCGQEEDRRQIALGMEKLYTQGGVKLPKVAVVVLSYDLLEDTKACIASIRATVPEGSREIIIVDNASTDGSAEWLRSQGDIKLCCNMENVGFPKGCNQGIRMAENTSDIFLLNNDTILPDNALFWLRMGLYEQDMVGSAGSVSNHAVNMQSVYEDGKGEADYLAFAKKTNIPMRMPYEERQYLMGFALLMKRDVLDKVGLLDERFSPGNYEDNDIGMRILLAGYKNLLCRNSFVIHWGSKSFGKDRGKFAECLRANEIKFYEKWRDIGDKDMLGYSHVRTDFIRILEESGVFPGMRILEIGCGTGDTLAKLKSMIPDVAVYGIEADPKEAALAMHFAEVVCADIEQWDFEALRGSFDCIILGDALMRLHQPERILAGLKKMLRRNGRIIAGVHNMMHYSVMIPLLQRGVLRYGDAGKLAATHLRMYTKSEIAGLFDCAGLKIERMRYTVTGAVDEAAERWIKRLVDFSLHKEREQFLAYEYLIVAYAGA